MVIFLLEVDYIAKFLLNLFGLSVIFFGKSTNFFRSLGMSPSIPEVSNYMAAKSGRIAFSDFLEIMHTHRYTQSPIPTRTIMSKYSH